MSPPRAATAESRDAGGVAPGAGAPGPSAALGVTPDVALGVVATGTALGALVRQGGSLGAPVVAAGGAAGAPGVPAPAAMGAAVAEGVEGGVATADEAAGAGAGADTGAGAGAGAGAGTGSGAAVGAGASAGASDDAGAGAGAADGLDPAATAASADPAIIAATLARGEEWGTAEGRTAPGDAGAPICGRDGVPPRRGVPMPVNTHTHTHAHTHTHTYTHTPQRADGQQGAQSFSHHAPWLRWRPHNTGEHLAEDGC